MRLKHRNIVRFVGYCYETKNECVEHNGKYIFAEMQQRLICLEYLPNGSLDMYLSDKYSGHGWHTRYKIIRGICYGLHYLHEGCQCEINASIIHLDLKPANILLDENMVPKVADFGLSRLFEDNKTQSLATTLSGTFGYMAPEYLIGRIITTKADIHSLGVIIIEVITGRRISILDFSSETSRRVFVELVLQGWRNRLEGASSETDYEQIKTCLEIGLRCVRLDRQERPTSREIIERLGRWENTNCNVNDEINITGMRATAAPSDDNNNAWATESIRGLFHRQLSRVKIFIAWLLSFVLIPRPRPPPPRVASIDEDVMTSVRLQGGAGEVGLLRSSSEDEEKFTFAQLETATNGFSLEVKIGEGNFGTVYRGKLPNGREVAIKRCFQFQECALRLKVAFLTRLCHKNLVGLVGYCDENEEVLLVYEYMENGALHDHLHSKETSCSSSPVASLWKLRIKILLDASRGIDYLHTYVGRSRSLLHAHGNVKSSNILLDSGWTARVSDFGDLYLGVNPAGTMVGYMDPEYSRLGYLTEKSDVYGFGVVMLEVLTGKCAIFNEAEGAGDPVSVVDFSVPRIVAGELFKVLDPRAPVPAAHEVEAVQLVAYIALHCIRSKAEDRPAMADIVASLETALALCERSCDVE